MNGERAASPFGARLRRWRAHRGISQLALAAKVGSTPRHLSFLETGRSRPSRQMVLRLADALGVGLRGANDLLHAAGLPATYPQADLDGPDLAPYRAAIDRMLHAHEPYPAMVVDGRWNVIFANRPCSVLFGPHVVGSNFVRDSLANPAAAQAVVNWPEVTWAGLDRLRHQLGRTPFDEELRGLVALAETALAGVARPATPESGLVVCPWFRVGNEVVRTIAMVARFDPVAEITLDELRIELMYPLDEAAERFFRTHQPSPTSTDSPAGDRAGRHAQPPTGPSRPVLS
jgi:transcriptional regulator with XRE-family HTH domain